MSWDFVTRLFWLPFDIMHRISRQIILLGRNVYGGLFGTKPAIKPAPSSSSSTPSPCSSPEPCSSISANKTFPSKEPPHHNYSAPIYVPVPRNASPSFPIPTLVTTNLTQSCLEGQSSMESSSGIGTMESSDSPKAIVIESDAFVNTEDNRDKDDDAVVGLDGAEPVQLTIVNENLTQVGTSSTHPRSTQSQSSTLDSFEAAAAVAVLDDDIHRSHANPKRLVRESKRSRKHDPSVLFVKHVDEPENDASHPKKAKLSKEDDQSIASTSTSTTTTAPGTIVQGQKKKKKRSKKKKNQEKELGGEETAEREKSSMARTPPNFFLAVEVSNKKIISKVTHLQEVLSGKTLDPPWHGLKTTEIFKDAMVPITKLHFTLYVMNLKGEEEVEKARIALTECCSQVDEEFKSNPLDLTIEGLGHFKNSVSDIKVLFAQIKGEEHISRLTKLSDLLREKLKEHDIYGDLRPFKPHMTIAKISRSNKLHKKKIRSFPPEIWRGCEETHFGVQRVNGVQLLCMQGEDKVTGYYRCFGQYYFHDPIIIPTNPSTTPSLKKSESLNLSSSCSNSNPQQIISQEEDEYKKKCKSETAKTAEKEKLNSSDDENGKSLKKLKK